MVRQRPLLNFRSCLSRPLRLVAYPNLPRVGARSWSCLASISREQVRLLLTHSNSLCAVYELRKQRELLRIYRDAFLALLLRLLASLRDDLGDGPDLRIATNEPTGSWSAACSRDWR
jgi:hypothetical protein